MREDTIILKQYEKIVDMLGLFFGDSVEVVLHSLKDLENSVIKIHNGKKTARDIGSPVTDKALKILDEFKFCKKQLFGPYKTISRDGHVMKSVTTVITNSKSQAIGMLCINFDLDLPLSTFHHILFDGIVGVEESNEHFATDLSDLLTNSVLKIQKQILDNEAIPQRQKNKAIVQEIFNQGLFNLRNAVPEISNILGLSKDVIYLHLRNLSNK